jgi:putative ABC transport system permease protein
MLGWLRGNSLNGGIAALGNVPIGDLLLILFGMPAIAAIAGWLFAGRDPSGVSRQPIN